MEKVEEIMQQKKRCNNISDENRDCRRQKDKKTKRRKDEKTKTSSETKTTFSLCQVDVWIKYETFKTPIPISLRAARCKCSAIILIFNFDNNKDYSDFN